MTLEPSADRPTLGELPTVVRRHAAATVTYAEPAARVSLVGEGRGRFSDETAALLHRRLRSLSFLISIIYCIAFAYYRLLFPFPLLLPRSLLLMAVIGGAAWLRFRRTPSLPQLRVVELLYFGAAAALVHLFAAGHIIEAGLRGDLISVLTWKRQFIATYSGLLLTYAMIIPNPWKRAAAVLLPAVCLPYLLLWALRRSHDPLYGMLVADDELGTLPVLAFVAAIGIYASDAIQQGRREVFHARRFGQYVLKGRIGDGGMGEVYRAEHLLLKRPCALKLIRSGRGADEATLARFEAEVRATARLSHVNTVDVYDYGRTEDGEFYYVMELLRGLDLDHLVGGHGPLPPARVVHLLRQVCGALKEAHDSGLIHRDIKPGNIFAAERGGIHDVAKLLDFGLVGRRAGADERPPARPGRFCGTPLYMAPEQASDYEGADARADIYAVGTVAYFLLTGRPPFDRTNLVQVLWAHATEEARPPSSTSPEVPDDLDGVILRCLAKRPADRYPDAASLEQALASCRCAGEWTEGQAADWWRAHGPGPVDQSARAGGGVETGTPP